MSHIHFLTSLLPLCFLEEEQLFQFHFQRQIENLCPLHCVIISFLKAYCAWKLQESTDKYEEDPLSCCQLGMWWCGVTLRVPGYLSICLSSLLWTMCAGREFFSPFTALDCLLWVELSPQWRASSVWLWSMIEGDRGEKETSKELKTQRRFCTLNFCCFASQC